MEKFHRVSNLFTMPNLLLACLQRQMGKHRNPQKHISKVRAEKVKNEWQEKQNAELNTVHNTYRSIIQYICIWILMSICIAPKLCGNSKYSLCFV